MVVVYVTMGRITNEIVKEQKRERSKLSHDSPRFPPNNYTQLYLSYIFDIHLHSPP